MTAGDTHYDEEFTVLPLEPPTITNRLSALVAVDTGDSTNAVAHILTDAQKGPHVLAFEAELQDTFNWTYGGTLGVAYVRISPWAPVSQIQNAIWWLLGAAPAGSTIAAIDANASPRTGSNIPDVLLVTGTALALYAVSERARVGANAGEPRRRVPIILPTDDGSWVNTQRPAIDRVAGIRSNFSRRATLLKRCELLLGMPGVPSTATLGIMYNPGPFTGSDIHNGDNTHVLYPYWQEKDAEYTVVSGRLTTLGHTIVDLPLSAPPNPIHTSTPAALGLNAILVLGDAYSFLRRGEISTWAGNTPIIWEHEGLIDATKPTIHASFGPYMPDMYATVANHVDRALNNPGNASNHLPAIGLPHRKRP